MNSLSQTTKMHQWPLLFAIAIMAFLINVDYTAVNLALIPMAREFQVSLNTIQWLLTGYVLAWAVAVMPASVYADRFRKKSFCIIGLSLFIVTSIILGLTHSISVLLAARFLQGVAGAIYVPMLYALIYINFPEEKRGKAMGILSLGVGVGLAMGPFIGGALISLLNWRSIFLINIPIGLLAAFIIYKNPESVTPVTQTKLNKTSAILLGFSMVVTLYLLSQWQTWPQKQMFCTIMALMAVVTFILFISLQKRIAKPLIPSNVFTHEYIGCSIGIFLEQFAFSTIIVALGIYFQKILHFSSLNSSLMYLTLTLIFGFMAAIIGPWIDRVGVRLPIISGLAIFALGSLLFCGAIITNSLAIIFLALLVLGIGMGLAFSGLNTSVVKIVKVEFISVASSLFIMFALLGNAFGVTLVSMVYEKLSFAKLQLALSQTFVLNSMQLQQLLSYVSNISTQHANLSSFSLHAQKIIFSHTTLALSRAINGTMIMNAIVCTIAFYFCFKLIRKQ